MSDQESEHYEAEVDNELVSRASIHRDVSRKGSDKRRPSSSDDSRTPSVSYHVNQLNPDDKLPWDSSLQHDDESVVCFRGTKVLPDVVVVKEHKSSSSSSPDSGLGLSEPRNSDNSEPTPPELDGPIGRYSAVFNETKLVSRSDFVQYSTCYFDKDIPISHKVVPISSIGETHTLSEREDSEEDIKKDGKNILEKFCFSIANLYSRPLLPLFVLLGFGVVLPVICVSITIALGPPEVDDQIDAFRINTHPAAKSRLLLEEIFRQAAEKQKEMLKEENAVVEKRQKRQTRGTKEVALRKRVEETPHLVLSRKIRSYFNYRNYRQTAISHILFIYYTTQDNSNFLTPEKLEILHDFENAMVTQEEYKSNCLRYIFHLYSKYNFDIDQCFLPISLNGFFYPTPYRTVNNAGENVSIGFVFDGFGTTITNFEKSFELLKQQENFYSYFDSNFDLQNRETTFLKSTVYLGQPLGGYNSFTAEQNEKQFDYILSLDNLMDSFEKRSPVKISYFCEGIVDYLVDKYVREDLIKTGVSLGMIAVLVFIFTGFSPWLTLWAVLVLIGSPIDNTFLYYVVFGIDKIGMLNSASGMLLIAIGVDDVLVFVNIFRSQSGLDVNTVEKVGTTMYGAAVSTFLTSATTAIAFAGNIVSSIPAVKSFGLFMSVMVMICWVLVVIMLPPALVIWERDLPKLYGPLWRRIKLSWRNITTHTNKVEVELDSTDNTNADTSTDTKSNSNADTNTEIDIDSKTTNTDSVTNTTTNIKIDINSKTNNDVTDTGIDTNTNANTVTDAGGDTNTNINAVTDKDTDANFNANTITDTGGDTNTNANTVTDTGGDTNINASTAIDYGTDSKTNINTVKDINIDGIEFKKPKTPFEATVDKIWSFSAYEFMLKMLNKLTRTIIKIRYPLLLIWLGLIVFFLYGLANMELSSDVPKVFSGDNRVEAAIRLRNQNAYVADVDCYKCSSLAVDAANFTLDNWNSTTSQIQTYPSRTNWRNKRSVSDPVRPLSSSRPLIAIILGIKSYHIGTHPFYHSDPDVHITLDPNFLRNFTSYESISPLEVPSIVEQVTETVKAICNLCLIIADNSDLVQERRGQCLPPIEEFDVAGIPNGAEYLQILNRTFNTFEECKNLPRTKIVSGDLAMGTVGYLNGKFPGYVILVFESTLPSDHSPWEARDQFLEWTDFLEKTAASFETSTGLTNIEFASDVFDAAFMEIAATMGALYSVGVSLSTVMLVLAFFTAYVQYLLIIMTTVLSCVLYLFGSFYYWGLEFGTVEVIVASILVGCSVDYVFHLVDSYSSFSRHNDEDNEKAEKELSNTELRHLNCIRAMNRIGLSIISSSLTTSIGCLPLLFAGLNPLRLFGVFFILASFSSLSLTLFFALPLLAILGPVSGKTSLLRRIVLLIIFMGVLALMVLVVYVLSRQLDFEIIGPSGL